MTALEPTLTQRWTRWRKTVAICALLIAGAIALALVQSQQSRGYLDPAGVDAGGSRALVRILEAEGVDVSPVRTISDATETTSPGGTVLVTNPDLLTSAQVEDLSRTDANLVLVTPDTTVGDFVPGAEVAGNEGVRVVDPECDLTAAELAGSARAGGLVYDAPASATSCYPAGDAPSLVVAETGDATVTILGTGDLLTNRHLDEDGNASLAMNLLGSGDDLTWYRPTLEAGTGGDAAFIDVLPGWVVPVAWQLAIAAVLAALWRARRFGPLVPEPLPAVVHAAEVTEGRAALYRHGRARGHAAQNLRDAATSRLRPRTGLPIRASADEVAAAIASRIGRPVEEVQDLLAGEDPAGDDALVRLANDLADLEARL